MYYVAGGDLQKARLQQRYGVGAMESLFNAGSEICRSLWDETSLLVDFDVEYVNFDGRSRSFSRTGTRI